MSIDIFYHNVVDSRDMHSSYNWSINNTAVNADYF